MQNLMRVLKFPFFQTAIQTFNKCSRMPMRLIDFFLRTVCFYLYTRSVQKVSDLFLSSQQGMSELPMQSVAAHMRIHA